MVSNYSYMESRGGKYTATVFVGLQYYLQKYLTTPVTLAEVEHTKLKAERHGVPFDYDGWLHIVNNCSGLLPIRIKAIPEGTLVPTRNVLLTIESTDTTVPWITGFVETLLMKIWYPTTVATKSYYVRQMLERYGSPEWAQFAYHNFGDRGSSSVESAAIGGFAHYTQFMGTDNFNSLDIAEDYYKHTDMPAYSVFATEHSTTTSYGREGEEAFVYAQLLANPDKAVMSFVADSYDVYAFTHFCTDPGSRIRKLIESRPHQKFVLRPDSGEPIEVINRILNIMVSNNLKTISQTSVTPKVSFTEFGILWGDGITPETIEEILTINLTNGFAAENFVFGSGGDLMQNVNRDTQRFAIKCSSITTAKQCCEEPGGTPTYSYTDIDVYKDPITAPGKRSKRGKVTTWLNTETGEYSTSLVGQQPSPHHINALQTIFENGKILISPSLENIRKRIT
ncbi:MAG: nicotinate phosphoribosyltransferase [Candidatus Thorarchaeota archaeon]|nr:MAG: nicotinate phosphoribosyltransferase [Candidatus Thorarchaeota archaeon]